MKTSLTGKAETGSSRATYQDVLDAPSHKVAEIVDGTLYTFPRPRSYHSMASSELGGIINPPFRRGRGGPGGWWILDEPELHLGEDIVVPDLAGWQRERMPVFPDEAYFTLAPDWVCEVLSPSTRSLDLGAKRALYAREGVGHLWLIDPDVRLQEAYELRRGEWVLLERLSDDATVSLPPFEAIRFNLGDLWPPPLIHKCAPEERRGRSTPVSEFEAAETSN